MFPFLSTESLDNTSMKEIKGLDERLAGLQQLMQMVQTLRQSQADMAQVEIYYSTVCDDIKIKGNK